MTTYPTSLLHLLRSTWAYRDLVVQMIRRDFFGRYQGSALGVVWSLFHPLMMLGVYTFVFGTVLRTKWPQGADSTLNFAFLLFLGLIVFNLFSEVVTRAPSLIIANTNLVKKVVFPLEILPIVNLGSAVIHALASMIVFVILYAAATQSLPWTAMFAPLVLVPLSLLSLGLGYLLSSLGVFLRDIGQVVGVLVSMLLFLSPVFYPSDALPEPYRVLLQSSPLTYPIEDLRRLAAWGEAPAWGLLILYCGVSLLFLKGGFVWFQKTRRGFADVL